MRQWGMMNGITDGWVSFVGVWILLLGVRAVRFILGYPSSFHSIFFFLCSSLDL